MFSLPLRPIWWGALVLSLSLGCSDAEFADGGSGPPIQGGGDAGSEPALEPGGGGFVEQSFRMQRQSVAAQMALAGGLDQIDQRIELTGNTARLDQQEELASRPRRRDNRNQGTEGERAGRTYTPKYRGQIDIVLVVDNSYSMDDERKKLANNLNPLISAIEHTDWQIALVTTDSRSVSRSKCYRYLFNKNNKHKFENQINRIPLTSNDLEKGFYTAHTSLSCDTPWWRPHSNLAVLVVSDEDNCSNGRGCRDSRFPDLEHDHEKVSFLTNRLDDLGRDSGDTYRFYSIVKHPVAQGGQDTCESAAHVGHKYLEAVAATSGVSGSICDPFKRVLQQISRDMLSSLRQRLKLPSMPLADSVQVQMRSSTSSPWVDLDKDAYHVDGQFLVLNELPPRGAEINVDYLTGQRSLTRRFGLSRAADPDSLEVRVNGLPISERAFSLDDEGRTLVFEDFPPALAEVSISYKEARSGPFTLNLERREYLELEVYLNDQLMDPQDYQVERRGNRLILAETPRDGDVVRITFVTDAGPVLRFDPGVEASRIVSVDASYLDTGASVDMWVENGQLVLAESDFRRGAQLDVQLQVDEQLGEQRIVLPEALDQSSVSFGSLPAGCSDEDIQQDGNVLRVACEFSGDDSLKIDYRTWVDGEAQFRLTKLAEDPDNYIYQVTVDGRGVRDFRRNGSTITITNDGRHGNDAQIVVKAQLR